VTPEPILDFVFRKLFPENNFPKQLLPILHPLHQMNIQKQKLVTSTHEDGVGEVCLAPPTTTLARDIMHHPTTSQHHSSLSIFCEECLWYYEKLMGYRKQMWGVQEVIT